MGREEEEEEGGGGEIYYSRFGTIEETARGREEKRRESREERLSRCQDDLMFPPVP